MSLWFVMDVESVGLHGEGFAVGWVVVDDETGERLEEQQVGCVVSAALGNKEGRAWVTAHVPLSQVDTSQSSPQAVRAVFWEAWLRWREEGANLIADCGWPVEAGFLIECVEDRLERRYFEGPYPLYELASILLAAGMDPMEKYDRLDDEPEHHPLGDARQSSRLLLQALTTLVKERTHAPDTSEVP